MERRAFGKTDMKVGVLGFGGAEIGFEKVSVEHVGRLLNDALDAGLNVLDTAECYLQSEELIGAAVSHRRDDFWLFSKCGHPDAHYVGDWRPESILKSIERSLKRLRTDHLDLVQLHSCSEEELRKGDVIAALVDARQRGYTRYVGYSGDSAAARYAIECGAFDALQTSVNIADQEALDRNLPLALERQMGVIAKRPIANAVWRHIEKPENAYLVPYWERLQQLNYGFLPGHVAGLALRFTLTVPGVHTVIVGTTKPARWRDNAALIKCGPLPADLFQGIRERWRQIAEPGWVGQT
jgi:aryl-alcohol dehydrogenase-like predicted oxidoreductase